MKFISSGPILICLAATLWALDGILRRSLFTLSPLTIVFFETLIGTLFLLPFFIRELLQKKALISTQVFGLSALVALLSGLLGTLWFTTALAKVGFISFSVVFLLQKLQPIFAISSARILLKEPLPKQFVSWAVLAIVAAYFVSFPMGQIALADQGQNIIAALFAFGAAAAWGTSTTFSKLLLAKTTATVATGLRFFFSMVFGFIGLLLVNQVPHLESISLAQYGTLTAIALSTGMVALFIYYKGLKSTPANVATILELIFPLLAIFIDAVLYKVILHPSQFLAAGVLLFAIYKVGLQADQMSKKTLRS